MIEKIKKGFFLGRRGLERGHAVLFSKEWKLRNQFEVTREKFFDNYWVTLADQIGAEIDSIGYGYYRLNRDGKTTFVRRGEVMLDDHITLGIAGNKPLVNKLLNEQGHLVSDYLEYDLSTTSLAKSFMSKHSGNFVVKPANEGAGGWGITTKVNTFSRLNKSSNKASAFSNKLIIEKELPGENYRLLYLNGELIDAIKRDSPGVTGDGTSTIESLIDKENRTRLDSTVPYALSPLTVDLDCKYTLSDRGSSLNDIPAEGERVEVKTATNQCSRFENHSVMNEIHSSIVDYGREISKVINVTLSGVDLMMTDCTLPLNESGCVVNEINTTPGLHHHALVSNSTQGISIAPIIIEYVFEQIKYKEAQIHSPNRK